MDNCGEVHFCRSIQSVSCCLLKPRCCSIMLKKVLMETSKNMWTFQWFPLKLMSLFQYLETEQESLWMYFLLSDTTWKTIKLGLLLSLRVMELVMVIFTGTCSPLCSLVFLLEMFSQNALAFTDRFCAAMK